MRDCQVEGITYLVRSSSLTATISKRTTINLDIFWLKDEALEDSANLPAPDIIAREIVDDLEAALEQFREIADDLEAKSAGAS
jgi:hypothetical protein